MPELVTLVVVAGLIAVGFCVLMLIRNERVFRYLSALNHRIYESQINALHGRPNEGLDWTLLDAADYDEMVTKFWRPLDSFFPDLPR